MTEQLKAQRVLAKTFGELSLRLLTKFLAFNLCLLLALVVGVVYFTGKNFFLQCKRLDDFF